MRVRDEDVLAPRAEAYQQIKTGNRGSARARRHDLDVLDFLSDDLEPVDDSRTGNDCGTVLVVMEDRDLHALAELPFDVEAFGRLDVFQVDAAECWLHGRDDIDDLVGIGFVKLDVEDVDIGEFLEQAGLAFHHRLARQRADIAETENGRAIRNDRDEVASRREITCLIGICGDRHARHRHAG